jgi:SdrD B-like domain
MIGNWTTRRSNKQLTRRRISWIRPSLESLEHRIVPAFAVRATEFASDGTLVGSSTNSSSGGPGSSLAAVFRLPDFSVTIVSNISETGPTFSNHSTTINLAYNGPSGASSDTLLVEVLGDSYLNPSGGLAQITSDADTSTSGLAASNVIMTSGVLSGNVGLGAVTTVSETPLGSQLGETTGTGVMGSASNTLTPNPAVSGSPFTIPDPFTFYQTYTFSGFSNTDQAGSLSAGSEVDAVAVTATPTLTTTAAETGNTLGSALLSDRAHLTGGNNPTGTITFTLTDPNGHLVALPAADATVMVNGNDDYTTPVSTVANQAGTYTWHAVYSGDPNNNPTSDDGTNESEVVAPASPTISTTPSGTVTYGNFTISGTKYLDLTGNGFSSNDTPLGGVTINLYRESNGSAGLQIGNGGDALVASTTTASNGTYSFSGVAPGAYYVAEVVPAGYVQTGGGPSSAGGTSYYIVNATNGYAYAGYNFDDYAISSCGPVWTPSCGGWAIPTACGYYWTDYSSSCYTPPSTSWCAVSPSGNSAPVTTGTPTITAIPVTLSDSATLSGGYKPTGTVTFYLFAPGVSEANSDGSLNTANALWTSSPVTADSSGVYHSGKVTFVPTAFGSYQWAAVYSGDSNNNSGSDVGHETECVNQLTPANPSISTTPNVTSVTLGCAPVTLTDTATVSGGTSPKGTITFTLVGPGNTVLDTETVTVNGDGRYTTPTGYALSQWGTAGTYQWNAFYSGDTGDTSALDSDNSNEQVSVVSPGCAYIYSNPCGSSVVCGSGWLCDSVCLTGYCPTGTITFTLYNCWNTPVYYDTVSVCGAGIYYTPSRCYVPTTPGEYYWQANYCGSGNVCANDGNSGAWQSAIPVSHGDAATVSFWDSRSGQRLIDSLNGSAHSTDLAQWLVTNFSNLYGRGAATQLVNANGTYFTDAQVASMLLTSTCTGAGAASQANAQALATALSAYATSTNLSGSNVAAYYGFLTSALGSGNDVYNVGSYGAALGLTNNTSVSILNLLEAFNTAAENGLSSAEIKAANAIFSGINTTGGV